MITAMTLAVRKPVPKVANTSGAIRKMEPTGMIPATVMTAASLAPMRRASC